MMMNYYEILKVPKTANDEDLRKSYKKLAMLWHPDKHPNSTKTIAESKFKQICQAYDILIDSHKRHLYDLYGDDDGVVTSGLYDVSSPSCNNNNNKATSFRFNSNDTDDIFSEFLADFGSDKDKDKDKSRGNDNDDHRDVKAKTIENKLGCTLEELYKGSKRKMKISRIVSDFSGKPRTVEETLAIEIKPGWKKGTKITFPEKGNQEPGLVPGDLTFVIDEKPHPTFKRDGNDLIFRQKLTLLEALTGKFLNMNTLDGRNLAVKVSDIVKPGHEIVIQDEGMPISRDPKKRGNLRIKFDVKFPSRLSNDQKHDLKRVLGGISS